MAVKARTRLRGEPVVMDTGRRRVIGRGIYFRLDRQHKVIYLRLGPLGWIRFADPWHAVWAARELGREVREARPYEPITPVADQLRRVASEMRRALETSMAAPMRDVCRWFLEIDRLASAVARIERGMP